MPNRFRTFCGAFLAVALISLLPSFTGAQVNSPSRRITAAIDENNLTTLHGNTHPLARAQNDRGQAPGALPVAGMLLVLQRGADQESALESLLEQLQDSTSPNFHHWLTPQQFGQQFGPSDQDVQTVTNWLQSHGFQVTGVSNGRTVIEFSGTASQINEAFHTSLHQYQVNGASYWANSSDPQIPTALAPVVAGVNTLYNFPRKQMHEFAGPSNRARASAAVNARSGGPLFTFPNPCSTTSQPFCNFAVSPADFAKIYNVPNLLLSPAPATQFNGDGVTIAIVGESDIATSDVAQFRSMFGLPALTAQQFKTIPVGPDPGVNGAETEADLDVEVSSAVAPHATINLVIAETTEVSLGVDLAAQYAVDNNLGAVLNESFGVCEFFMGTTNNTFYDQIWQQAAAQGISVFVSSGDSGSALCDGNLGSQGPAQLGLTVSGIASTPYNVAVGGTDFNDVTNPFTFWSQTNNSTTLSSALGYIPEVPWNDSCTNPEVPGLLGLAPNTTAQQLCNNPQVQEELAFLLDPIGGSGGQSNCTTSNFVEATGAGTESSCSGGYAKPAWQTKLTPADGKRDLPDVSLFASNGFNQSAYAICEADAPPQVVSGPCGTSELVQVGGTSASSPAFAAILALVNQATGSRQGNANPILYNLAGQTGNTCTSAASPASTCVFYDIPSGATIAMPCVPGTPNCTASIGNNVGVLSGYNTSSGYDLASGLGSINATNLISDWKNFALTPSTTVLSLNGGAGVNVTHGQSVPVNITVTGGGGTPSGNASLIASQQPNAAAGTDGVQGFVLGANGVATGSTTSLPGGSYSVIAQYSGDGVFASSKSSPPVNVTVAPEASQSGIVLELFNPANGAQTSANATSATYGSAEILRMNVTSKANDACLQNAPGASGCPTGNVTITNNGSALDGGTFPLNSQGYTEDQSVQLPGGTDVLAMAYPGDNSFTSSTGTATITITKAPTSTNAVFNPVPQAIIMHTPAALQGETTSQSLGVAPGGTFTVLDGTTPVGSNGVLGFAATSAQGASCQGGVTLNLGPPSGTHTLTMQYSGDGNYAGSTSNSVSVDVVYPVTATLGTSSNNVVFGASVTITAIFSTGNPASNAALKPTGSVSMSGAGSITPVTTTVTQDSSGNWILQATATTTPQQSQTFFASYSGDSNYQALVSPPAAITVTIPDFSVSPGPSAVTIPAGQTGMTTITVTPTTNLSSTVALTCGKFGFVIPGVTCTLTPATVALAGGTAGTSMLSLGTTAPSSNSSAMTVPIRTQPFASDKTNGDAPWAFGLVTGLAALLLFAAAGKGRRYRYSGAALVLICGASIAPGCGGGSGGGGGGGGGGGQTGPIASVTTVSTATTKIAPGVEPTFTATVSSSKSPTGTVTFTSQTCGFTATQNLVNGSAQIQVAPSVEICDVSARYSGDGNNLPSQSGTLNIVFTGTSTEQINAQTATDIHTIVVNVTLQ
jgi:Pro-kumamolisin, activation domain/Bacterial Ig-like domain (group 3)